MDSPASKRKSLKSRLLVWFVLLALAPMALVSWIGYQQASGILIEGAKERLKWDAIYKQRFINNWFDYRFMDLRTHSSNPHNWEFLKLLASGYRGSELSLDAYVGSDDWLALIEGNQDELLSVARNYDYISNLFLIDTEGNLLFSTTRNDDLGTNLISGDYSDTQFAAAYRETLNTGKTLFSDLEYYAPLNNELEGFLTTPLVAEDDHLVGVFAIQVRPKRISDLMAVSKSRGTSLKHYLIGEDGRLRSPLGDQNEVLRRELTTDQVRKWLSGERDASDPLWDYEGPHGKRVFGLLNVIETPGVKWALVSEVDRDETLAQATWLKTLMASLVTVTGLLAVALALYQSRNITRPIMDLVDASRAVSAGEAEVKVSVRSDDELGELGEAFNTMLETKKRHEEAMEKATLVAEDANRSKSEFLANMSHEIRTPMNGVIGMTNLLLDSGLNREQMGFAKTVKDSAGSLLGLINDILDYSKVEAGKLDLEILDFELGQFLSDFAGANAIRSHEKGLEFICPALPVDPVWLKGDPGRIRQILTNLVGNAVKFTERGEIALFCDTSYEEEGFAKLSIKVADTGIGLTEEQRTHLFERFEQADGSTTRLYGGTGLGLAICKQLVEMMEGEIWVDSENGQGSVFCFTLKLPLAEMNSVPLALGDLRGEKVLAVDDNGTNRCLLHNLLDKWGATFEMAASGEEALQLLAQSNESEEPFSIAILDMQMPRMDGMELAKRIKELDGGENLPLVMLTSQVRRGDASLYERAGFAGYLGKPVSQNELLYTLVKVLRGESEDSRTEDSYSKKELPVFDARILVVDDNQTNQAVARGILEKFGARVDLAGNGREALSSLSQMPYDLVLMDCQMPVMDGFETSRRIRSETGLWDPAIPVVAMTANAMQGDREACVEAGMDDYVTKPVDPEKLGQVLEKFLDDRIIERDDGPMDKGKDAESSEWESKYIDEESGKVIFDYDSFRELTMGDESLMLLVVESFMTEMSSKLQDLARGLEERASERIHQVGHSIKGASSNVGGVTMSVVASEIEMAGKTEELDLASDLFPVLEAEYAALKQQLVECRLWKEEEGGRELA